MSEENHTTDCDCRCFRRKLLNLSREILVKDDEKQQWEMFEQFIMHNYRRLQTDPSLYNIFPCSRQICWCLIHNVKEYRSRGMSLSNLLVDLMSEMYVKHWAKDSMARISHPSAIHVSKDWSFVKVMRALRGETGFMELLLKCGSLSSLQTDNIYLEYETHKDMMFFIRKVTGGIHSYGATYRIKEAVMKLLKGSIFQYRDRSNDYGRFFIAGMAIRAILLNLEHKHRLSDRFVACVRMYYIATRDIYLTKFEMRCILYACFFVLDILHLYDVYSQEFDKLMPECPAAMEPRRLIDLARCQVRQNIDVRNLYLIAAVKRLPLPRYLKRFVLGDVIDISRQIASVSSQQAVMQPQLFSLYFK